MTTGRYVLELFGWAWLPECKTFWFFDWVNPNETDYPLFLFGWFNKALILIIFNKTILGKKGE